MKMNPLPLSCVSWKKIVREKELWCLIVLGGLYFFRPLFLGETFFFRDLNNYFLPQKQLLTDFFQVGEWPLWDPYLHGGQGYATNIANAAWYPFNLLYLFLPQLKAFTLTIAGHLIGCAACAYLCARTFGLMPASSFVVGLIYGFCGYTLSLVNLLNFLLAMPYLPLLCASWHRHLTERRRKWFVISVIIGGIQVLPGAPELNIITLLLLFAWTMCYPYHASKMRRLFACIMLGGCILGVTSFQLFPTVEIVRQSVRGQRMEYGYVSPWSLPPQRLPELVAPNFFGHIDAMPTDLYYWGTSVFNEAPYILSLYMGIITLTLAITAGIDARPHSVLPVPVRRGLCFAAILALLCAFGRYWPFFEAAHRYLPMISIFRYPIKFQMAGIFPCALLAGYAFETHFVKPPNGLAATSRSSSKYWQFVMLIASIALIGWTALFFGSDGLADRFQQWLFQQPGNEVARAGLRLSFAHVTVAWSLFALLWAFRQRRYERWQHWLVAGVLVLDLFLAGKRINPTTSEAFYAPPPMVATIQREIGDGRLFQTPFPESVGIFSPTNHAMWRYHLNFEQLEPYSAAFFRIPVIFHLNLLLLEPRPLAELTKQIERLPWAQRLPLLSAGNVRLIITPDAITDERVELLAEIPTRADRPLHLYRNMAAAGRLEFAASWEAAASAADALTAMRSPTFDPRKHVVLQGMPPAPPADTACAPARIRVLGSRTYHAQYAVSNDCDGYLVFSEPFYAGWHARVDDAPVAIAHANYAFSAIFLQSGDHRIERYYRPGSLLLGSMISLLFCIGLIAFGCGKIGKSAER